MNDRNPASLTSSLLARKGDAAPSDAAPSDAGAVAPDVLPEVSVPIEGPSIDPDPLPDDFLSRGPDAIVPEPDPIRPSWQNAADHDAKEQPRRRRAPLLALAALLVLVLAGSAWFAAGIFLDGGGLAEVTGASVTRPAAKEPTAAPGGLRNASGSALAPSRPAPGAVATTQPSTRPLAAPAPVDPVTTDPQDAPRVASSNGGAMPAVRGAEQAPAVAPPPPPPAPPVAAVAPTPAPKAMAPTPAPKAMAPVKPAKPAATPIARPKPAVKMASRTTGTFALQLSSVRRAAIARAEVKRLTRRLADVLNGTALRIRKADLGRRGTVYRIQTAAVLTSKQAKQMCGRMKSRKQPCFLIAK